MGLVVRWSIRSPRYPLYAIAIRNDLETTYNTGVGKPAQLNSTMLGARRPVNGDTESPVVVDASRVCAALAGAVCMQCPSLVRAGKGPGVAAPPSTRVA